MLSRRVANEIICILLASMRCWDETMRESCALNFIAVISERSTSRSRSLDFSATNSNMITTLRLKRIPLN